MSAKPAALILIASLLSACATTEVTLLFGPRSVDGETDLGAFLMVSQPFGKRGLCSYMHQSNPVRGVPFNDRDEMNMDAFPMCGVRWGGN